MVELVMVRLPKKQYRRLQETAPARRLCGGAGACMPGARMIGDARARKPRRRAGSKKSGVFGDGG